MAVVVDVVAAVAGVITFGHSLLHLPRNNHSVFSGGAQPRPLQHEH